MTLEEYRRKEQISMTRLSSHLGINIATIHGLCNQVGYNITMRNAYKIVNGTGGQVKYDDLVPQVQIKEAV